MASSKQTLMNFLDFEKQFAFYGAYHSNPVNVGIHLCCIWPIVISALSLAALLLPTIDAPQIVEALLPDCVPARALQITWLLPWVVITAVAYPVMEPLVGSLASLMAVCSYIGANLYATCSASSEPAAWWGLSATQLATAVHVWGWLAQFWGHAVHEKRAPALLDSLAQALFIAPLFVLVEIAFMLGYRPQLYKRIMEDVNMRRAAHFESKAAAASAKQK